MSDAIESFIARWAAAGGTERANYQLFLNELADLLDVERPQPQADDDRDNAYVFERRVTFRHGDGSESHGYIDLFRRGAFVCEAKRLRAVSTDAGLDAAMLRARSQAEQYARALPADEGRPPFLLVVDVGNRIELYSEFSRSGATYTPYPDPRSHRIALADLRSDKVRARLRAVWLDPLSLDPSRESARVTRDIATRLAELARSLEADGHSPERVAQFLMRCLFSMFAEDVRLLPEDSFRNLLARHAQQPDVAMRMLEQLWRDMDSGGFSAVLAGDVLRFNGKLFKQPETLPLNRDQIDLMLRAARADWRHVEPAIFGTLLERALVPEERHKLGAHYTPRAYVERLVLPAVIEPLRAEWSDAQAAALTLAAEGRPDEAVAELLRFHHRLCAVRVLDPACGSGNFLYVTLEHLKRLEGEVLNALDEMGHRQTGLALAGERADAVAGETVDPHNLLGIEVNPRAAAIAEVVLWIGYLQWHFRTRGDVNPPIPVIRDFRNIECRDAVLAWDRIEPELDERGAPITRWDGRTTKAHPVTGEEVPDEAARAVVYRYVNPRLPDPWPRADFIVGNPPYLGNKRMRIALGDGYVEALRTAWHEVPDTVDFVMYWWQRAAALVRAGEATAFGLITTNSLRQTQNRQVTTAHLGAQPPLSLRFVIPDHPWIDSGDGADVRVALSVGDLDAAPGRLVLVTDERAGVDGEVDVTLRTSIGHIHADLSAGAKVVAAVPLRANTGVCFQGMNLVGKGFRLAAKEVQALGYDVANLPDVIKPHCNARDLMQGGDRGYVIDLFGLSADEARERHPALYQWLLDRVKPERDHNNRESRRRNWWLFGEPVGRLRAAWRSLSRVVVTPETAKHRVFTFIDLPFCPDHKLYAICLADAWSLGVLSSEVHKRWALSAGGTLEDRPTWTNTTCFLTFPFPARDDGPLDAAIDSLAQKIDTLRKRSAAGDAGVTLTASYNVLDKLRSGEPLTAKERVVHDHGLVGVLRELHDALDSAVLAAYGWSDLLPVLRIAHGNDVPPDGSARADAQRQFDAAILERLVALNADRAAEEARGFVRWLRPPPQMWVDAPPEQDKIAVERDEPSPTTSVAPTAVAKRAWPRDAVQQVRAVAEVLSASTTPLAVDELASRFTARGSWKKRLPQLLGMLVALGRAREENGRFRAV